MTASSSVSIGGSTITGTYTGLTGAVLSYTITLPSGQVLGPYENPGKPSLGILQNSLSSADLDSLRSVLAGLDPALQQIDANINAQLQTAPNANAVDIGGGVTIYPQGSPETTTDPGGVDIGGGITIYPQGNPEPTVDPSISADQALEASLAPVPIKDPTTLAAGSDPTQQFDIGGGVMIDVASGPGPSAPSATGSSVGLQAKTTKTQSTATEQDQANFPSKEDWRVRLSLTPEAKYLYAGSNPGILAPLKATNGVIFPYTPAISVNYAANYEATNIVHSNYKIFQYTNSSVDQVTIASDFTCQDTFEANYLLAVIHFFRSMTKMFYGQDQNPKAGTPPPLCYMYGMGSYQFSAHPLAITGFSYSLPTDVDYIPTTSAMPAGTPTPPPNKATLSIFGKRLPSFLQPGGILAPPQFSQPQAGPPSRPQGETTWVPTKIQLSISCIPIISRNTISNRFSLNEYASGRLLNGTRQGPTGGGIW